ncbi:MAG TPA: hypothetical protein VFY40_28320, partial [Blastocatellia bacterium]|nr:hypothetical protein [Blastocatellia bacterium]
VIVSGVSGGHAGAETQSNDPVELPATAIPSLHKWVRAKTAKERDAMAPLREPEAGGDSAKRVILSSSRESAPSENRLRQNERRSSARC